MEISEMGLIIGVTLTIGAAVLHFIKGTPWSPTEDISQSVLGCKDERLETFHGVGRRAHLGDVIGVLQGSDGRKLLAKLINVAFGTRQRFA